MALYLDRGLYKKVEHSHKQRSFMIPALTPSVDRDLEMEAKYAFIPKVLLFLVFVAASKGSQNTGHILHRQGIPSPQRLKCFSYGILGPNGKLSEVHFVQHCAESR